MLTHLYYNIRIVSFIYSLRWICDGALIGFGASSGVFLGEGSSLRLASVTPALYASAQSVSDNSLTTPTHGYNRTAASNAWPVTQPGTGLGAGCLKPLKT